MTRPFWLGLGFIAVLTAGIWSAVPLFYFGVHGMLHDGVNATLNDVWAVLVDLSGPLANSFIIGIAAATLGAGVTWILLFGCRDVRFVIALAGALLFFPGVVTAHGFQYFVHDVASETFTRPAKSLALLVVMIGYVIPFQIVVGFVWFNAIAASEISAATELFSRVRGVHYWAGRLRVATSAIVATGLAMAVTEVPRSQVLGDDQFGFGMTYFGPVLVNQSQSSGILDGVLSAVGLAMGVALAGVVVLGARLGLYGDLTAFSPVALTKPSCPTFWTRNR